MPATLVGIRAHDDAAPHGMYRQSFDVDVLEAATRFEEGRRHGSTRPPRRRAEPLLRGYNGLGASRKLSRGAGAVRASTPRWVALTTRGRGRGIRIISAPAFA